MTGLGRSPGVSHADLFQWAIFTLELPPAWLRISLSFLESKALLTPSFTLPSLLSQMSDQHCTWRFSLVHSCSFSPSSFTNVYPNDFLTVLIPFWHRFPRGPELMQYVCVFTCIHQLMDTNKNASIDIYYALTYVYVYGCSVQMRTHTHTHKHTCLTSSLHFKSWTDLLAQTC